VRKIVAGLLMSLDGVVESPGVWGFPHYINDEMTRGILAVSRRRTRCCWGAAPTWSVSLELTGSTALSNGVLGATYRPKA
jgi:hypothetical protein